MHTANDATFNLEFPHDSLSNWINFKTLNTTPQLQTKQAKIKIEIFHTQCWKLSERIFEITCTLFFPRHHNAFTSWLLGKFLHVFFIKPRLAYLNDVHIYLFVYYLTLSTRKKQV